MPESERLYHEGVAADTLVTVWMSTGVSRDPPVLGPGCPDLLVRPLVRYRDGDEGAGLKELQELLGHALLTMTMRCAHPSPQRLRSFGRKAGLMSQ